MAFLAVKLVALLPVQVQVVLKKIPLHYALVRKTIFIVEILGYLYGDVFFVLLR
jgi:hypothetical protein